jgi:hypothetical protein
MAAAEIQTDFGPKDAFLVETRSLSGFSGSPVFLWTERTYRAPHVPKPKGFVERPAAEGSATAMIVSMTSVWGPWLLGINFGHLPFLMPVYERDKETGKVSVDRETNLRIDANTGIATVSPAWKSLEILMGNDLVKERRKEDQAIAHHKSTL